MSPESGKQGAPAIVVRLVGQLFDPGKVPTEGTRIARLRPISAGTRYRRGRAFGGGTRRWSVRSTVIAPAPAFSTGVQKRCPFATYFAVYELGSDRHTRGCETCLVQRKWRLATKMRRNPRRPRRCVVWDTSCWRPWSSSACPKWRQRPSRSATAGRSARCWRQNAWPVMVLTKSIAQQSCDSIRPRAPWKTVATTPRSCRGIQRRAL
jgi:hypothetical protein